MDGRPHPPEYAAHTWGGFSTGTWEGDRLRVQTTHMKEDYYRRNGVPQSDKATLTEYLMRRRFQNEDYLTWVIVAYDPVYLTEPLIRSTEYRLNLAQQVPPYPCTIVTEVVRPEGYVPNWLPGKNDQIYSFSDFYGLPRELYFDGAETMYPDYREKLERVGAHGRAPGAGTRVTMTQHVLPSLLRRAACSLAVVGVRARELRACRRATTRRAARRRKRRPSCTGGPCARTSGCSSARARTSRRPSGPTASCS